MIYETNTTPPNLQYISSSLLRGLVITPVSEFIFQSSSLFHRTSFNPMNHSISLFVIFLIDLEKTENRKSQNRDIRQEKIYRSQVGSLDDRLSMDNAIGHPPTINYCSAPICKNAKINSFTTVVQILHATSNVPVLSDSGPIISISHV